MYKVIEYEEVKLPEFDLDTFYNSTSDKRTLGIALHTKLQAALMELILRDAGKTWEGGVPYNGETDRWCWYEETTVYYVFDGTYGTTTALYGNYDYQISAFSDFDFSKYVKKYDEELRGIYGVVYKPEYLVGEGVM